MKDNLIGNEGAIALADALKYNSILTTLNLNSNSIKWKGINAFGYALRTNITLKCLYINCMSLLLLLLFIISNYLFTFIRL